MKKISLLALFHKLIEKIFPTYCLNCKKEWEWRLCKSCKKLLVSHPEICPICHKFSKNGQVCLSCQLVQGPPIEWIMIAFSYNQVIKKLIISLKYYHNKDVAKFLSERLYNLFLTNDVIDFSNVIITFVPTFWSRKIIKKWYNQSEQLARNLAKIWNYPFIKICKKIKNTKSQLSLSRNQRLKNLDNVFYPLNNLNINLKWKTIIIVDDLTTTWTTILKVAECIRSICSDCKIWWLVVARHNR